MQWQRWVKFRPAAPGKAARPTVYAAGGGRKFAFSFVFLLLLPFFISRVVFTGAGSVLTLTAALARAAFVPGRRGTALGNSGKPNAEVRSPKVERRQGVMFGIVTPVSSSRNCRTEVWSKASLAIQRRSR